MAMANYDGMAMDEAGRPVKDAIFTSPAGVGVQIYKNWVYVSDDAAWSDQGHFERPVIMQVCHGLLEYKDVDILVLRGPRDGAYVVASSEKVVDGVPRVCGMIGCGVYSELRLECFRWFKQQLKARHFRSLQYVHDVPEVFRQIVLGRKK